MAPSSAAAFLELWRECPPTTRGTRALSARRARISGRSQETLRRRCELFRAGGHRAAPRFLRPKNQTMATSSSTSHRACSRIRTDAHEPQLLQPSRTSLSRAPTYCGAKPGALVRRERPRQRCSFREREASPSGSRPGRDRNVQSRSRDFACRSGSWPDLVDVLVKHPVDALFRLARHCLHRDVIRPAAAAAVAWLKAKAQEANDSEGARTRRVANGGHERERNSGWRSPSFRWSSTTLSTVEMLMGFWSTSVPRLPRGVNEAQPSSARGTSSAPSPTSNTHGRRSRLSLPR